MGKNQSIKFKLINADILEYKYVNPAKINIKVDTDQEFEVKLKIDYKWNIENNRFGVIVGVLYFMNYQEQKHLILETSILIHYEVYELNKHFHVRSPNDFDMDIPLETSLVSIAISTSRGILIEKTNGTLVRNIILPVVQPSKLILSPKKDPSK